MKKFILFIPVFFTVMLQAQVAYHDAIRIKKLGGRMRFIPDSNHYCLPDNPEVYNILRNYVADVDTTMENVEESFGNNPFIKYCTSSQAPEALRGGLKSIFSSVGGLDVTNIANGVAQFMIERAKEELTIAFFNRFKRFSEDNPEFKVLFPKTADNLENLLSYKYPEMLPALRTGFFEDLKSISYHLDDVLELPRYQELLKNFPEVRVGIRSIRIIHEIESGDSHPADVLKKFAEFPEWIDTVSSKGFRNFGSSVKLASIFSNSLRYDIFVLEAALKTAHDSLTAAKDSLTSAEAALLLARDSLKTARSPLSLSRWSSRMTQDSLRVLYANRRITQYAQNIVQDSLQLVNAPAWISFKEVDTLVRNDTLFKIYLGLVYQLVKKQEIKFHLKAETKLFTAVMREQKDNIFLFQNKVKEFIELANIVDEKLDTLQDKRVRSIALTNDDYYDYIDASLDVIEYGFSIGKLFNDSLEVEKYTKIARKSNDLYRNIYKREYTQAFSNGIDILSAVRDMINDNKSELIVSLNARFGVQFGQGSFLASKKEVSVDNIGVSDINSIAALLSGSGRSKYDSILVKKVIALVKSKDRFNKLTDILDKINKYGLFMANIVNAETPEEVASVLESAALPVGSSSIKKNSAFNISLQSYLGGYRKFGYLKETHTTWSNKWGVIAPIGVAFSGGMKKGGAFSLFVSLFDIGAIVDYQLKKEPDVSTTSTTDSVINKDYKVKLGQIFSPGGYLVYGFPYNIPLSFGIGGQYGPGLGKVEAGNTVVNNPQWRCSVFLAVDIPFFNLVNRPKKYRP